MSSETKLQIVTAEGQRVEIAAVSEAHAAYQRTRQFQEYMAERKRWEAAHADYLSDSNPHTRNQLTIRAHAMQVALRDLRATPEHKAAFGW